MNKKVIIQKLRNSFNLQKLNQIGGIIQIISLLLPTTIIITKSQNNSGFILIWLYGLVFIDFKLHILNGFNFMTDNLYSGSIITIILLYIGIVSIRKESTEVKYFGYISIILLIIYYIVLNIVYIVFKNLIGSIKLEILIIPFIGFFGIIFGAVLVIFSSIRSEK